jgi:HEAT repeat protein
MKPYAFFILTLLAWLMALPVVPVRAAEAPAVPKRIDRPTFGGERIVTLLGSLLDEDDPMVRQQAVQALGQTHNDRAIPAITRAAGDADPAVRKAAIDAAAELGYPKALAIIAGGLNDPDPAVVRYALAATARLKLLDRADRVTALLAGEDGLLQTAALQCLTALGRGAPAGQLTEFLGRDDIALRLAAADNARCAKAAKPLLTALRQRFAQDASPAVRARAIEALGTLAPADSRELLDQANQEANVLIRAAAVRAWAAGKTSAQVADALDDPSPLVRLEALRAAGRVDLIARRDRIAELMLTAPDELTHLAARDALANMGRDDIKQHIAKSLDHALTEGKKLARPLDGLSKQDQLPPPQQARQKRMSRRAERLERNAATCCWLLGHWREQTIGYDTLLSVLKRVELDSPVLGRAAWALGYIGRAEAAEPLAKILALCRKRGVLYLRAMAAMRMGPPYSEDVTAEVAIALARLGYRPAMKTMVAIARTRVMDSLLSGASRGMVEALAMLMTDADRPMLARLCVEIIETPTFSMATHAATAVVVGRKKLAPAEPAVRMMFDRRETRLTMAVAAWALGELTGKTPEIPQPVQNQGDWILKEIE